MKRVFSAGGIVIREGTKGANGSKGTKVLVIQHSGHHGWDFPKGHIETGESSKDAAIREVEEETGAKAEIVEKVGETKYFYYEDKEKVFKTVVYYLMKYIGEGVATTPEETSAMEWLPVDKVDARLSFKDTKRLWGEAKGIVERLKTKD